MVEYVKGQCMKRCIGISSLLVIFFTVHCDEKVKDWTWLYQKVFTQQEITYNGNRPELQFTKMNTPLFSQLVFPVFQFVCSAIQLPMLVRRLM